MQQLFFFLLLSLLSTTTGVVYYVKPTEPCAHNSSCPSNETCHTMDNYASKSSHYFSPDHINVTLYFLPGVHNCTWSINVSNLQSFAMIGTAGRQHVTIYMPIPTEVPQDPKKIGKHTYIFTDVSKLRIENATVYFISLSVEGDNCLFEAEQMHFYGHVGPMSAMVSVINITRSQATLRDCTFQNNCFIRIQSSAVLTLSDSAFSLYNHAICSVIGADNSTIKLTGAVSFINNKVGNNLYPKMCGAAIAFNFGYGLYNKEVPTSVFNITGGLVRFLNNRATECGGALYLKCTVMSVVNNATVLFRGNVIMGIYYFGAGRRGGGAMLFEDSSLIIKGAKMDLIRNFAHGTAYGGAIFQINSSIHISKYSHTSFVSNTAAIQGGALCYHTHSTLFIDNHSNLVFYNNSAGQGGALYLYNDIIRVGAYSHLEFRDNKATIYYGGAIYGNALECLFSFKDYTSTVIFKNNFAYEKVGMQIYGGSVKSRYCMHSFCYKDIVQYTPNITNSLSPVSSPPKRVCLCDTDSKPQCAKLSSIYANRNKPLYRGESFNISVVVVGYDFGTTTGSIHTGFIRPSSKNFSTVALHSDQYHKWIGDSARCSNISYNLYSINNINKVILYFHPSEIVDTRVYDTPETMYLEKLGMQHCINLYRDSKHRCIENELLTTPVLINITLLDSCPPGFTLSIYRDQLNGCLCYQVLYNYSFDCYITNNAGYLKWNSTIWVNATFNKNKSDGILIAHYCPLDYCKSGEKIINLGKDPDFQCANNHAGVLCGGCEKNFSIAIGSSHCVMCPNDNGLLLILFFLAAGLLLVILILVLNLTVTQGLINGLIFYSNNLWTYKNILFLAKKQPMNSVLQVFIAWLNLDFGIEICFVDGLTSFWKTWLQFLFPLYIWLIAGVIIVACHYSSRLTNLIGDKAVPLLTTLFLLSYTKLLRTVTTIFEFGVVTHYPNESKIIVWYIDGSLQYCQHPHIYLFIVAMVTLFFCLSFTLFFFLIQCWRRFSHLRLLRWINRFTPFYDAYFAPLKDRHHYWFGTLLAVRGALLIAFTVTSSTLPLVGLLILAITLAVLLSYMSVRPVYESKLVRIFETASILNLLVFVTHKLYTENNGTYAMQLSTGFAFIQFLAIIIISIVMICYRHKNKFTRRNGFALIEQDLSDDDIIHERVEDPDVNVQVMHNACNTVNTY